MEKKGTKLKKLTLNESEFVANGKLYFIEPELSAERFKRMQELEIELGFGANYKHLFDGLKKSYGLLNENKFADAAVFIHNLMNSLAGLEERRDPIMEYCAMFINTAGEDRRKVDEKMIESKINDWKEEGINYHDFFRLAVNMVRGLKENYLKSIQDISQETQETSQTEEE